MARNGPTTLQPTVKTLSYFRTHAIALSNLRNRNWPGSLTPSEEAVKDMLEQVGTPMTWSQLQDLTDLPVHTLNLGLTRLDRRGMLTFPRFEEAVPE